MAKVQLTDGSGKWFDCTKAQRWEEDTRWDGRNHISLATGSQWDHERLYKTASGTWVLHTWSQWQGSKETYEVVDADQAYRWLARNGHYSEVPETVLEQMEV